MDTKTMKARFTGGVCACGCGLVIWRGAEVFRIREAGGPWRTFHSKHRP